MDNQLICLSLVSSTEALKVEGVQVVFTTERGMLSEWKESWGSTDMRIVICASFSVLGEVSLSDKNFVAVGTFAAVVILDIVRVM